MPMCVELIHSQVLDLLQSRRLPQHGLDLADPVVDQKVHIGLKRDDLLDRRQHNMVAFRLRHLDD